jgi:hypothetical protein
MFSDQHKNESNQADLRPNITPLYPAWVKELMNQRIDVAIARAKRTASGSEKDPVHSVKPKPR